MLFLQVIIIVFALLLSMYSLNEEKDQLILKSDINNEK